MVCRECGGEGYILDQNGYETCEKCDGSGEIQIKKIKPRWDDEKEERRSMKQ